MTDHREGRVKQTTPKLPTRRPRRSRIDDILRLIDEALADATDLCRST